MQALTEREDAAEFLKLVCSSWSTPDADDLLEQMDNDGDGIISFQEFAAYCIKKGANIDALCEELEAPRRGPPHTSSEILLGGLLLASALLLLATRNRR